MPAFNKRCILADKKCLLCYSDWRGSVRCIRHYLMRLHHKWKKWRVKTYCQPVYNNLSRIGCRSLNGWVYSGGAWPSHLTDLLNPRLVGAIELGIEAHSCREYSAWLGMKPRIFRSWANLSSHWTIPLSHVRIRSFLSCQYDSESVKNEGHQNVKASHCHFDWHLTALGHKGCVRHSKLSDRSNANAVLEMTGLLICPLPHCWFVRKMKD